jgi:hypothetical protein
MRRGCARNGHIRQRCELRKFARDVAILTCIIGHKLRLACDVGAKERHNIGGAGAVNME